MPKVALRNLRRAAGRAGGWRGCPRQALRLSAARESGRVASERVSQARRPTPPGPWRAAVQGPGPCRARSRAPRRPPSRGRRRPPAQPAPTRPTTHLWPPTRPQTTFQPPAHPTHTWPRYPPIPPPFGPLPARPPLYPSSPVAARSLVNHSDVVRRGLVVLDHAAVHEIQAAVRHEARHLGAARLALVLPPPGAARGPRGPGLGLRD
jgi:hypothetical protein